MAHLHGPAGTEGTAGVLQGLSRRELGNGSAFSGTLTLTDSQLSNIVDGLTYINIHTTTNPKGEVRGQLSP